MHTCMQFSKNKYNTTSTFLKLAHDWYPLVNFRSLVLFIICWYHFQNIAHESRCKARGCILALCSPTSWLCHSCIFYFSPSRPVQGPGLCASRHCLSCPNEVRSLEHFFQSYLFTSAREAGRTAGQRCD